MQQEVLMRPATMSTRWMVTFAARTQMLAFTIRTSWTTVPGVVTTRSLVISVRGVHPAGTPVFASVGKPPVGGGGGAVVVVVRGGVVVLVDGDVDGGVD